MKEIIAILMLASTINQAFSATTSANVTSYIKRALSINKVSDMNFGTASPGDPSKVIPPGSSENLENASFKIYGEPNSNFFINMPYANEVKINTGNGGTPQTEIIVREFKTNADGSIPKFDDKGSFNLYVGATRDQIRLDQTPGPYIGHFPVIIIY